MRDSQAYIERIRRVNRDHQWLELAVDKSLASLRFGQALLVRRIEKNYDIQHWQPYLRQLWFPVEVRSDSSVVVEQPISSQWQPGQLLSVIGPIGNPARFRRKLRNILLIAMDTAPGPLLMALPTLLANNSSVTMVLMGAARGYETSHLPEEIEITHAEDDLTWQDMVMTLGWADQAFALAAPGAEQDSFSALMRLVRERRHDVPANAIFGIFRRDMPCGVGACFACAIRDGNVMNLLCLDGPAFDLARLILD